MSLTVSLQTAGGGDSAVATAVGQQIQLNVVATVQAPDGSTTYDHLQDVTGSFLSTAIGSSAVAGNLSTVSLTSEFTTSVSVTGDVTDLNGDGNLDTGGSNTDPNNSSPDGYFHARSSMQVNDGTVSGSTMSFVLGTITYTVTAVNGGGETSINFRPRAYTTLPIAASWLEGNTMYATNEQSGTFRGGNPFRVYGSPAAQSMTGTVTATAYADTNGDGTRNAGETAQSGATVYVDLAGTGTYATGDPSAVTDTTGTVTITGVPAGSYAVRVIPPTSYNGYSQSEPASGGSYPAIVAAGQVTAVGTFGIVPDGSVAGTVYIDSNGNGAQDATETNGPAAGTVVYLDVNHDGTFDAGDLSTATVGTTGTFSFPDVPAGTYALRTVVPTGYDETQPGAASDGTITVVVAPGEAVTGQTFGFAPQGSITGTAYDDANGNGTQDGGEAGLAGVTVYVDANGNGVQDTGELSTTTDDTGAFTFAGVAAGTYTVRDVAPAGDTLSTPTSLTATVTNGAAAAAGAFGVTVPVVLNPNTVAGTVYTDTNRNGQRDVGEAGDAGATVFLDANGNGTLDATEFSTTTDTDGSYTFTDVDPGTYPVAVVVPDGSVQYQPAAGTVVDATVVDGAAGANVAPFGVGPAIPTGTTLTTGAIAGTVTTTATDGTSTPLAGATVFLDANGNGLLDTAGAVTHGAYTATTDAAEVSTVTAADGTYTFADLTPGTYTVRAVRPLGTTGTTPAGGSYFDTVTAATAVTAQDFAVTAQAASPLTAAVITGPAATAVGGTTAVAKVRITNGGTTAFSGPATVALYPSDSATVVAAQDVPIGSVSTKALRLKPGKSAVVAVKYTYPVGLASGTYHLVAAVTGDATLAPALAAAPTTVAFTAASVDLAAVIVAPAAGVVVNPGKRSTVAVRVTNTGNVTADGTVTARVLSSVSGTVGSTLGSSPTRRVKIRAGRSAVVRVTITAPANSPAGSYDVVAAIATAFTPTDNNPADDTSAAVATR